MVHFMEEFEFEAKKLENLINEIRACCEERAMVESRRFGIPSAEIELLKLLGQDKYATVTGLSSRLGVAKSRITKLISGLMKKGYVIKTEDPQDGRVKLFTLSTEGKVVLKHIVEYETETFKKLVSFLALEEKGMIIKALDSLRMAMERLKKDL